MNTLVGYTNQCDKGDHSTGVAITTVKQIYYNHESWSTVLVLDVTDFAVIMYHHQVAIVS